MRKISVKLIVGILLIVLIASALSGLLFATMYKDSIMNERKNDLLKRGGQIASFSYTLMDETIEKSRRAQVITLIEKLTDSTIWIVNQKGNIIFDSEEQDNIEESKLNTDIEEIKDKKNVVTEKYSQLFEESTLSVGIPIIRDKEFKGAVYLHTPISDLYKNYRGYMNTIIKILMMSVVLSVILGALYSIVFTKNIEKMKRAAIQISAGNYNVKTGVTSKDEFGELAKTLDSMAADINRKIVEIERLEKMSKELVANVSHEFKTPLTIIRGYIENIQDGVIEPSNDVYNKIVNNTKYLEKMVNDVLDLSKLESGQFEMNKETFELDLLIENIAKEMNVVSGKKNVQVVLKKEINNNVLITADYAKIRQMFIIFVDNAIKYSPEGGKVNIIFLEDTITIEDEGMGIKPGEIEHIFDRFYQSDKSRKKEGYGLGLCIAKQIIDMHDFTVRVDSQIGKGTKIIIKT